MRPIQELSYWFSTCEPDVGEPALEGERSCDIAIIGGGFTGLWSAFFIKAADPSASVVVLEQDTVGYGASGRNGGMVCSNVDQSTKLSIEHFGIDESRHLVHIAVENLRGLGAFAADCDFEQSGQLHVALSDRHLEEFNELADAAAVLGIDGYRILNRRETRARLDSPLYEGGLSIPQGGIVNPLKIVRKLKRECALAGVAIHEHTPVTRIERGRVCTKNGAIRAKRVILATDAFSHLLFPELLRRFVPLYDYVAVTEPLTSSQLASLGWTGREGVSDGRAFFNYYRLTADNRILWGSSEAKYYPHNDVNPAHDCVPHVFEGLHAGFYRHFPQLQGLRFEFHWGGPIASTTRLTPMFGTLLDDYVVYGLGYTGEGIANSRLAGQILSALALGKQTELTALQLVRKKPYPFPPEPIRGPVIQVVSNALRSVDSGGKPNTFLRLLDRMGIGFSS